jgi:hypothetical protein
MTSEWVVNQNYSDPLHNFYDFRFESSLTPLYIHARVYWNSTYGDGWYYGFPRKVAFGIYGPFKNECDAINECNKKIKTDVKSLVEKFGGIV